MWTFQGQKWRQEESCQPLGVDSVHNGLTLRLVRTKELLLFGHALSQLEGRTSPSAFSLASGSAPHAIAMSSARKVLQPQDVAWNPVLYSLNLKISVKNSSKLSVTYPSLSSSYPLKISVIRFKLMHAWRKRSKLIPSCLVLLPRR
jgi:hypothetical protein